MPKEVLKNLSLAIEIRTKRRNHSRMIET
jgi:hypothetical protein